MAQGSWPGDREPSLLESIRRGAHAVRSGGLCRNRTASQDVSFALGRTGSYRTRHHRDVGLVCAALSAGVRWNQRLSSRRYESIHQDWCPPGRTRTPPHPSEAIGVRVIDRMVSAQAAQCDSWPWRSWTRGLQTSSIRSCACMRWKVHPFPQRFLAPSPVHKTGSCFACTYPVATDWRCGYAGVRCPRV